MSPAGEPGPAGLRGWFDARLPGLAAAWRRHATGYFVPRNLNFWYCFGALALLALAGQLLTGLFLAMHYVPTAEGAFASVQRIMRDVDGGWLIRYLHAAGASLFFLVIYLHMARGLMYGSYRRPRELVWLLGVLLYLLVAAEAFMGYVLPWGQMSFWGAKVVASLFGTVPFVGDGLAEWVMGDVVPSGATLGRFFALHAVGVPLVLLLFVAVHVAALRQVGSGNPDGTDLRAGPRGNRWSADAPVATVPYHPYQTLKDLVAAGVFMTVLAAVVLLAPDLGGLVLEPGNLVPADPLSTPEHIRPAWYFAPYYAMLRSVPGRGAGALLVFAAIAVLFLVPWLDRGTAVSVRQRGPAAKAMLGLLAASFIGLGLLGLGSGTSARETWSARGLTAAYFAFFALMPLWSRQGRAGSRPSGAAEAER